MSTSYYPENNLADLLKQQLSWWENDKKTKLCNYRDRVITLILEKHIKEILSALEATR